MNEEVAELVRKARPTPELLAMVRAMLRNNPASPVSGADLQEVTRILNFLRMIDSASVISATIAIEHRVDDRTINYATAIVGSPKRLTALKVLLDDAIFKMIAQDLARRKP